MRVVSDVPTAEEITWAEAFNVWASPIVARWNAAYPDSKPFTLSAFDGCTLIPDWALAECLEHDLASHHGADMAIYDRKLRDGLIALAAREDNRVAGWWWVVLAWVVYGACRAFGGGFFRAAKRLWRKGEWRETPRVP